ncbi:DNA repair protein rhp26 [Penicillium canariense]|uniref:DNA repair protein rhp26 n=1 Tax=Penicillium canariense TaxID=189055 RepID=A0A9W9IF74_9EURO|nr:DNA repair protein rhp26 [Penicillium canariense]KAJ5175327.1 DNA repair protein rhp26 [Penicillium canariense]
MASPTSGVAAEASRLQELNADVRNQDDLERDITRQADKFLAEKAEENDTKRLEKALVDKELVNLFSAVFLSQPAYFRLRKVDSQIRQAKNRLAQHVGTATRHRVENELRNLDARRLGLVKDIKEIQKRIDDRRQAQENAEGSHGPGRLPNESRRDYLLRTGKITPFELMTQAGPDGPLATLQDALIDAEDQQKEDEERQQAQSDPTASHRNLLRPELDFDETSDSTGRSSKRRKLDTTPVARKSPKVPRTRTPSSPDVDSEASYVASEGSVASEDEDFMPDTVPESATRPRKRGKAESELEDLSGVDDGNEKIYQDRLQKWIRRRSAARKRAQDSSIKEEEGEEEDADEWLKPHPSEPDMDLQNGLRIPGDIAKYLFSYQRTGVQWLWELHQQSVGGIIGDEMGLGKTIQAIAYLASLHHSNMYTKPAIVVCPATLMKQWVNEFHRWWPPFRVSILHSSGSGMMNVGKESSRENALTSEMVGSSHSRHLSAGQKAAKKIIRRVKEEGHVLVTTYSGLQSYADALVDVEWGCAVLDEGHKIRNPDAGITFSCKELRTAHRIILSGTPMQNSLIDLWSLFDFVFPMRLGTLVTFKNQFEIPIRQGGYASATNLQVQTAAQCAATLKDAISPYLLQRYKADVTADLPQKTEQVIFCKLTQEQRTIYKRFLESNDMMSIMRGRRNSLFGIDILRKICNHPDLVDRELRSQEPDYGESERSGKMQVLKGLLEVWRDTGHKTLLFAQTRQMLDIIQKFIGTLGGFQFRRMDGNTPIKDRQTMVDEFNKEPDIHVFLLTTRVGGIGVNLTGADRVIIYDPDWNPSTDMQARERAWRLGQKRDVTIFRLMMKGTIEEKIYHRQIFKQFLTNKITRDPQQREGFQASDLYDLFSLTDENDKELETTKLFKNADVTYQEEDKATPPPSKKGGQGRKSQSQTPKPDGEDIRTVQGVANVEEFTPADDDRDENGNVKTAEDRIMHGIFARSGVHAALEHDHIINGKRTVRADPKLVEAAARRVAAEAAAELRKAEEAARSVPIGLPTWTGQFGVAGRTDLGGASSSRPAARGPSSSHLLSNLNPSASRSPSHDSAASGPGRMPRGKDFMPLIRDFLRSRRGPVFTQVIVDQFNHYCTNPQRVAEFQAMLKTVARLERDRGGRGRWTLKPEFAGDSGDTTPGAG